MAELAITKLDPDSQLLLDQPLLRLPYELLRKNLKTAQRHIEQAHKTLQKDLQTAAAQNGTLSLATLDATLAKAQSLKRKLEQLHVEEQSLHRQQRVRIQHLQQLHDLQSLADVKYDEWSHTRLDRLLVDYILRQGSTQSAKELAEEKGIQDLVDVDVFEECGKIEKSLRAGKTQECLSWCNENKQALKKINVRPESVRVTQHVDR
jgi:macrophage erythroblast attacher